MEKPKELKQLAIVMGVLGTIFLIADVVFISFTPALFYYINKIGKLLGFMNTPLPAEEFYLALTNSMMLMLVYISFCVYVDVKKNINMVPIVIFSKFISSLTGLLLFVFSVRYFAYLVIPISDFPICVIVAIMYSRAKKAIR